MVDELLTLRAKCSLFIEIITRLKRVLVDGQKPDALSTRRVCSLSADRVLLCTIVLLHSRNLVVSLVSLRCRMATCLPDTLQTATHFQAMLLGVCGFDGRGIAGSVPSAAPATGPAGGVSVTGGRAMIACSISVASDQRCLSGANAFMMTCSKPGEISGRKDRTGGKVKRSGLLVAGS